MPNALDDAMMMSYNWNKGMDERLKKIRETFTPAEIDEGIEYMNSQSAARRAAKEMPPEKKERMVALAKENEERFQLINNLRRRYSIEELKDATEYLNWCREEAKKKPDVSKEDEEIANSILQMQDAIENALKTGDPETAIRLKNRLYDIQKTLAREEEIVKATAGTSPPVSYRNMDPKSLQIELNNAILTGNLKKIAEIKRIITGEKID